MTKLTLVGTPLNFAARLKDCFSWEIQYFKYYAKHVHFAHCNFYVGHPVVVVEAMVLAFQALILLFKYIWNH